DDFKAINDNLGHLAGDRVLQLVAERIQSCLRLEDIAARLGGDEFCAILDDINSAHQAVIIAERIITALGALDCSPVSHGLNTSIGISIFPHHGTDTETLLQHADNAMYMAKRLGKGRCQLTEQEKD
ncbi:MAG: GGDEF domain-containing protein, partial [Candidatus Electrothrix sp. AR3]|nr:GGDEF domain-containing protein [Candidatus Electrothrix sp. AR3]